MLEVPSTHAAEFPVVGIGASAGGITALQSLFHELPPQPTQVFIVAQHLRAGHGSQLAEMLGRWTSMPVHAAVEGMKPQAGHVYVAAPEEVLTLENGAFRTQRAELGIRRPGIDTVDALFESLATGYRAKAIGIVLSGTGSDGAAGCIRIKQDGGLVFVQDPVTAMHDGMPMAAMATGAVDRVLPLPGLAQEIAASASPSYKRPETPASWPGEMSRRLDKILELIRIHAGFDLSGYKTTPLLWRIQKRMEARYVQTFEDYEALILDDPAELEALIRGIPVHVTEFFRDAEAWDVLARDVLAPLLHERAKGPAIRAWSAACASGQEAYSLAMLLSEGLSTPGSTDFRVFATDASPEILARASRGSFSETAVQSISSKRRARFFYKADAEYRVKRELREKMVFAPHDLLADPPFTGVDLVVCRNLLIYLDPEGSKRVLFMLHSALRMGGYLFLGKGEALSSRQGGFETVSSRWNIYRKNGPLSDAGIKFPKRLRRGNGSDAIPATAHRAAVENFEHPSVLIDDKFRILQVFGDTTGILRMPAGQPTNNILELAPKSLAPHIKLAAIDALTDFSAVTVKGLQDAGALPLSVRLTPLRSKEKDGSARMLVSFIAASDGARQRSPSQNHPTSREAGESTRISEEELEASREELEAVNEELKATNEQLNISNEDLNESNLKLEGKVAELLLQSGILSSAGVIALFVDPGLRIRWFTPGLSELFPIRAPDAGRPITDLKQNFDDGEFIGDIRAVIQTGTAREKEVRNVDGRLFLRRIRPYRLPDSESATGAAVTFTDITERARAEAALRESEAKIRTMFETMIEACCIFDLIYDDLGKPVDWRILEANAGYERQSGLKDVAGKLASEVMPGTEPYWIETFGRVAETGEAEQIEKWHQPTGRWVHSSTARVGGPGSRRLVSVFYDITERKRAEQALRESEAHLAKELEDARVLQEISNQLVSEGGPNGHCTLMRSDAASIQELDAVDSRLKLLAHTGFHPESAAFWAYVDADVGSSCGRALTAHKRVVVPDMDKFEADPHDIAAYRKSRIMSVQSTPLVASSGRIVGMMSTHWNHPHTPSAESYRFFDILARLAADFIERKRAEIALRESERMLTDELRTMRA